ncbi:MAG: aldo/keto reductase, partial [Desulfovibrio sp.]|nr:aldo/keto reductase [Desulfovibrio sp.]
WLLAKKSWIVPIPGTTSMERLEENLGAADIFLNAEEFSKLDKGASAIPLQGERYPEELEKRTGL